MSDGYLLDNRRVEAGRRFEALAAIFDPATFRHFAARGVATGWRCWEVGAGGPSVPRWLAARVGPTGRVLATDLDVSWLGEVGALGVEARVHDVARDAPPNETFDLVHARLVLVHVPDRDAALARMAGALRPGGWLVIEDADPALQPLACPDARGPDEALANRIRDAFRGLLAARGAELAYGRTLPRRLREVGLVEVGAEMWAPIAHPACAPLELATIAHVRAQLAGADMSRDRSERRIVSDADLDRHVANVAAGRIDVTTAPMISAWGRRA